MPRSLISWCSTATSLHLHWIGRPKHRAAGIFGHAGGSRHGSVESGAACCPACHTSLVPTSLVQIRWYLWHLSIWKRCHVNNPLISWVWNGKLWIHKLLVSACAMPTSHFQIRNCSWSRRPKNGQLDCPRKKNHRTKFYRANSNRTSNQFSLPLTILLQSRASSQHGRARNQTKSHPWIIRRAMLLIAMLTDSVLEQLG